MSSLNMFAIDSELLKIFCFWGSILALKLMAMVLLTARLRFSKQIFMNPDDVKLTSKGKVLYNDPDIERVRRSHLNDLENIPIWFVVTLLWLTTGPSKWLAANLIRAFVFTRIAHTCAYAIFPMQPFRAISFFVGFCITMYQAVNTLLYYL